LRNRICELSSIITAHNEGDSLVNSLTSVIRNANKSNFTVHEILVGLDNASAATKDAVEKWNFDESRVKIFHFSLSDVGHVRNELLRLSKCEYVSFLDGDDIWGDNWLEEAFKQVKSYPDAVFHPELTIFFDSEIRYVRKNPDSTDNGFEKGVLLFENLWTSSFITPRWIMEQVPMKGGGTLDKSSPFAYEDWSWFRETLSTGIEHRVVNRTAHFHRLKDDSNTTRTLNLSKRPWPIEPRNLLY
jgi:glycosyltransferase involved in cell wall biosynthesis